MYWTRRNVDVAALDIAGFNGCFFRNYGFDGLLLDYEFVLTTN